MTSGQVKSVPNFWSANLAHRELRNATFEGKKSQPQLHFRTLYIVECTKHEARTIGKKNRRYHQSLSLRLRTG